LLDWDFQFSVLISGTPIGSKILIPFLILDVSVIFFLNSPVEKSSNCIPIPKFRIPNFVLRRNSIYLISHETLIAIAQPVDLTILNSMDVGTIPGKDILPPN
jgi:hypothetical protein